MCSISNYGLKQKVMLLCRICSSILVMYHSNRTSGLPLPPPSPLPPQVLQAQVDSLLRGEGDIQDSCTQTEETLAGEACAASLQAEQGLAERLEELTNQGLPCHPEENDQLDLILETDGLRKSIHNLGAVVSTR